MRWTNDQPGVTVSAFVKAKLGNPWSVAKRLVETGKVFVDGSQIVEVDFRLLANQEVEVRTNAPRPIDPSREGELVYDDAHVVVINKPEGINSVPYEDREQNTAMDMIRATWKRQGVSASTVALHVVHRIDRATSGLLVFAKSKRAELGLAAQFRDHSCEREYLCVANGAVKTQRIESLLVADRGDGLRGSTSHSNTGKRAITNVNALEAVESRNGVVATVCAVRLETGKTHQIRIHLSEAGHPLVGETVYNRDFFKMGKPLLNSKRLLLHAHTLGFVHPVTGELMRFRAELPKDFLHELDRIRAGRG